MGTNQDRPTIFNAAVNKDITATVSTIIAAQSPAAKPRYRHIVNQGGDTAWISIGGTATAADNAGHIRLVAGDYLETTATNAITAICAATKTTELAINGWG